MSLNENPIFLTQKRLAHRGGVLAPTLTAALIGLSLFAGMVAYRVRPGSFSFGSPQDAGMALYAWALGLEILFLVLGGFHRITTVLANERRAGLWDSNRLTPLKPWQLVTGYWLGAPLRETYMSIVLAAIGLLIVLLGRLSLVFWLGTQLLAFSTALFLGLLAIVLGLVFARPQNAMALIIPLFFAQIFSLSGPMFFVPDFLLPVYGIGNLFAENASTPGNSDWIGAPTVFGLHIHPILLTLALQAAVGIFLWRIAVRKTANPFQSPLFRWETIVLFAILVGVQQGLVWGQWHGYFPVSRAGASESAADFQFAVIHCGVMLLALVILGFASPPPERIRVKVMRLGIKTAGGYFSDSAVSLAFSLTAVAGIALLPQFFDSLVISWEIYVIAVANLLSVLLIFPLILEFCRLRHKRHAGGFVAFWLFVVCILPFILAAILGNGAIVKFSPFAPGCAALADSSNENLNSLLGIVAGHLGIACLLFIFWREEWKTLLARAA